VMPSIALVVELSMAALGADNDFDGWMQSERLGIFVSGSAPAVLVGDEVEVLSGKLELTSNAFNVTVEAGQCLVEDPEATRDHPFEGLMGGECGQVMVPTPDTDPIP